jgi:predicted metalloendopeptidase
MKIDIGFSDNYIKKNYKITFNIIQNFLNINKYDYKKNILLCNKKNNKNIWPINPLNVNACYISNYNKIIIPFGILNKPFYNINFPLYKKYAILGSIIGHEISHGIDVNNIIFDSNGNIEKKNMKKKELFKNKIRKINRQFKKIDKNYKKKVGENVSDLYGLSISLLVYKNLIKKIKKNYNSSFIDLEYKKFFKSYIQLWRYSLLSKKKKFLLKYDVHSLAEHRVNITLHNIKLFRKLYNIKKNNDTVNIFNI